MTYFFFFFNDTATTEIYTLSLHDALPILLKGFHLDPGDDGLVDLLVGVDADGERADHDGGGGEALLHGALYITARRQTHGEFLTSVPGLQRRGTCVLARPFSFSSRRCSSAAAAVPLRFRQHPRR